VSNVTPRPPLLSVAVRRATEAAVSRFPATASFSLFCSVEKLKRARPAAPVPRVHLRRDNRVASEREYYSRHRSRGITYFNFVIINIYISIDNNNNSNNDNS
jgi:hypothetical protein